MLVCEVCKSGRTRRRGGFMGNGGVSWLLIG